MKIAVTGGSGYLGTHLMRRLQSKGIDVLNLDTQQSNLSRSSHRTDYCVDIRSLELVNSLLVSYQPDALVHLAALKSVPDSITNPKEYFSINSQATVEIAKIAAKANVKKFIFASSAAVYGSSASIDIIESCPTNPLSPYGESKLSAEKLLSGLSDETSLQINCLRIFNLMGFGDDITPFFSGSSRGSIQFEIWKAVTRQLQFSIFGSGFDTLDGTALRDYIHPDDVVTVIIKLLENGGIAPYLMNVGSGDGKTVLEIVEKARKISGVDFVTTLSPSRPGDIPSITANIFEVSKLLGSIQKTTSLNTLLDFLKHS